ncbi:MAG: hypothetical protein AVDCRST_MAG04-112, partial [uncultured Acetobacteraceae bacterium]
CGAALPSCPRLPRCSPLLHPARPRSLRARWRWRASPCSRSRGTRRYRGCCARHRVVGGASSRSGCACPVRPWAWRRTASSMAGDATRVAAARRAFSSPSTRRESGSIYSLSRTERRTCSFRRVRPPGRKPWPSRCAPSTRRLRQRSALPRRSG